MKRFLCMLLTLSLLCTITVCTPLSKAAPGDDYVHTIFIDDFESYTKIGQQLVNSEPFVATYEYGATGNIRKLQADPENGGTHGKVIEFSTPAGKTANKLFNHVNNHIAASYPDYNTWKKIKIEMDFYPVGNSNKTFRAFYNGSNSNTIDMAYMNDDGTIGLSQSGAEGTYNLGQWNTLTFLFDLSASPQSYKIYLNGGETPIATNTLTDSVSGIHRFGFIDRNEDTATTYFDNLTYSLVPFSLKSASVTDNTTNVQVTDTIVLNFTKAPSENQESLVSLTATNTTLTDEPVSCTKVISGNDIIITLDSLMEFETDYKLTIDTNMTDAENKNLKYYMSGTAKPETIEINFKTMKQGIVLDIPVVSSGSIESGTVSAKSQISNFTGRPMNVRMYGGVYDSSNKQLHLTPGVVKNFALNEVGDVSAEIIYAGMENHTVKFFPVDSDNMKLLRTEWLTFESSASSASALSVSSPEPLSLDVPKAPDANGNVSVSGRYTAGSPVLVYLKDKNGSIMYANPMVADSENSFSAIFTLVPGEYTTYVSTLDTETPVSSSTDIICMSDGRKTDILNTVNNSTDLNSMKNAFQSAGGFKEDLMMPESVYTDAAYQLLFEQKTYASVDSANGIKDKITEFSNILPEINAADWTVLKSMLSTKSEIILNNKNAQSSYLSYNSLDDSGKSRVCQLTVNDNGFLSIDAFRLALANAITAYYAELSSSSQGGTSNSGGMYLGGGSGSIGTSSNQGGYTPNAPVDTNPVTPPETNDKFADLSGYEWAETAIYTLRDANIISKDTHYRPDDEITREEYAKLVVMLMGIEVTDGVGSYNDVDISAWYAPYIKAAKDAGIVSGRGDNSFGVGENITRQDMMVMAYRALEGTGKLPAYTEGNLPFTDADTISGYARDIVAAMYNLGIINGMDNSTIAPLETATRAQAAKIIYSMMSLM